LIKASQNGYLEVIEKLIEAGADDFNARDNDGMTALIIAVRRGHLEVVETLIKAGADVNAKNDDGKTAMAEASDEMRKVIIEAVKRRKEKEKENEPGFMGKIRGFFSKG
jgi:ankyrin repeat protein